MARLCGQEQMQALVREMQSGDSRSSLERIDALLVEFPDDHRLHFLRGSILIGQGRHIDAHRSLARAVALDPDYPIARFQLGFFQLTSGEADNALETWARLERLPPDHYLRKFVDGLTSLIKDDFAGAIAQLREGIERNDENAPLNHDMRLIIDECTRLLGEKPNDQADATVSETSLLLRHLAGSGERKH
jgi:predicted Zn-dependent protease